MSKKYLSYEEALAKLQHFCAYQERCHQEVKQKILDLGVYGDTVDEIIATLIEDNFLNEMRFAAVFAGGKFRIKKWGRNKIKQALKQKRVSEYCIKKALKQEISVEDYYQTLVQVIKKKNKLLKEPNIYKRKQKLARYAVDRGFESSLAWEVIKNLLDK